jgi:uncharacterized protein (TIGR02646 family)
MRPINRYFGEIPPKMQEKEYQESLKILLAKVARGETIKTAEDIKGYAPMEVKTRLEMIFHKKCAFCESNTKVGSQYDTEHFRPKKTYYWLAYEWSNFLLSCQRCNREYKLGRFPIEKTVAEAPRVDFEDADSVLAFSNACHIESDALQNEERLLLHPVLDNPTEHLEFMVNGEVIAKSKKGEESIRFYGLNNWEKREELISARKKVIKNIDDRVKRAVNRYAKGAGKEILYDDLLDIQMSLSFSIAQSTDNASTDSEPYMGVIITCLKNFKSFFIDSFVDSPYETILEEVIQQIEKDLMNLTG